MTATSARPLRLLFAIDSLGSGGAQRQMVTLAHALAGRGHVPVFVIYQPDHLYFEPDLVRAGIEVRKVRKPHRFSLAPAAAMRRILRAERFDAVLAYLKTPAVYAELATLYPGRPPLVVSERASFVGDGPTRGDRVAGHLHRLADVVVVNSHHHREAMADAFPWLTSRLRTIWNGVDATRFSPPAAPAAREAALLAVGSIRPLKNARGLAQALLLLHERGRPVPRIRWAGKVEPYAASADEKAAVDAMLAAAGLTDRWEWLGEQGDVAALMRRHEALVHPSLLEGLPNAVCEALASGMPVLAGAVGDQTRLVEDGRTGLLFEPQSPESIAGALDRFQALAPAERSAMGAAAVDFAATGLSVARMADEYEALFTSLAGGRPPSP